MGNKENIIELIDQTDDEHIKHFQNGASKDYINGWVEACEEIKKKIEKFSFTPRIRLKINSDIFDDRGRLR